MYVRLVSDSLPAKQETFDYLLGTSEPKDETSQEKIYWIGATRCKAPSVQRDPGMLVGRDFFHKSKCPFFDYYFCNIAGSSYLSRYFIHQFVLYF